MSQSAPQRRRYSSALRSAQADQTRATVLAAATRLFVERGWGGTGMRDVARAAKVSVETVYANFGSKSELLKQALDVAIVGDTDPIPLAERSFYQRMATGSVSSRIHAVAELLADLHPRVARLRRVLDQAAAGDPQLEELLTKNMADERESVRMAIELVISGPAPDERVDAMFAMQSTEVFLLLTEARGWSVPQYQSWITSMIRFVLSVEGDDE